VAQDSQRKTIPSSVTGRRSAVLIAVAVVIVVVLVVLLGGLRRSGGGSAADSALRREEEHAASILDHPKPILPMPDASFRSFQAWYYDLRVAYTQARKALPTSDSLQAQIYDRDTFPPQVLQIFPPRRSFIVLDSDTVNGVLQSHQPAFTTVTLYGHSYRAYVAPLTIPANLRPASVGGYFAVLRLSS
jgi:hypothetical protein